jgi:cytochrome c
MRFSRVAVTVFSFSYFPFALADVSKPEALKLLNEVIAYAKINGTENLGKEFLESNSKFKKTGAFVTILDMEGRCIADGANAALVGRTLLDETDSSGKLFVKEGVMAAKARKPNWLSYKIDDSVNKSTQARESYTIMHSGFIYSVTVDIGK